MKELGVYVHIPFCKDKCYYCDFISYVNIEEEKIKSYVENLIKEIWAFNGEENYVVKTIYIGGGTPSYIDHKYIEEILKNIYAKFEVLKDVETTIEVNPGTVDLEKLEIYNDIGINRISIGLQTDDNKILKTINRVHTYQKFIETYEFAKKAGFKNISVDIMFGLPGQTLKDVERVVEAVSLLDVNHISVYSLIVEDGTTLEKMLNDEKLTLPEESVERKMYHLAKNILEKEGYIHYEISNFAKKGFESKHNVDCWSQNEYTGFGIAAHSYVNNIRYSNLEDIDKYIKNIENDEINKNYTVHEKQNKFMKQKEAILLGFRLLGGINIKKINEKHSVNMYELYKKDFVELEEAGLIQKNKYYIRLTKKGLDFANVVFAKFL